MGSNCIFCQIVQGVIPAHKVYEDEFTIAFLDKAPVQRGHVLVIPKDHYERLEEVDIDDLETLIATVQKVGRAVMKLPDVIAYNVRLNNGPGAGQIVDHVHFHVIPRYANDGLVDWEGKEYGDNSIEETKNNLIKNL